MSSNKPGMFSIWKISRLVIALGALGYRIFCNIYYFDSITDFWGGMITIFFVVYLMFLLPVYTTFTRGWLTMILALVTIVISTCILFFDGLSWVGNIVSLDDRPLSELGYYPIAHLLNIIAGTFELIGFFSIRKHDRKKAAG